MGSANVEVCEIFGLFRHLLSSSEWSRLGRQNGFQRRGIFSLAVVVWLMIVQRLQGDGSLSEAVQQLRGGALRSLLGRCKRVRDGRISTATGGYCRARQKLSILAIERVMDELFARLRQRMRELCLGPGPEVFLLDGTSVLLQHQPELKQKYPAGGNQHGQNHWPVLKMVVFHEATSGVALRPSWGAMYGEHAVSEQTLAEQAVGRIPEGATVVADCNFGIFWVAEMLQQHHHGMILRLTADRVRRLLGRPIEAELEQAVEWRPSREELRAHPELARDARVLGRLIVRELKGARQPWLCLFTTLEAPVKEVLELYAWRWNVETDLRSLKQTLAMQQMTSKSVDMMEKELMLAMAAYNLVRSVMALAAMKTGLRPRQFSFTRTLTLVQLQFPKLLSAQSYQTWSKHFNCVVDDTARYHKLPTRSKTRSYPREVWGRGARFPTKKPSETGKPSEIGEK
jgi:putative transposase